MSEESMSQISIRLKDAGAQMTRRAMMANGGKVALAAFLSRFGLAGRGDVRVNGQPVTDREGHELQDGDEVRTYQGHDLG